MFPTGFVIINYLLRRGVKSTLHGVLLAILTGLFAASATAHEVRPAIGDVEVTQDAVRLDLRLALEGLVAGIDLAGLDDTDNSPLSGYYDQLRALPPADLETAFNDIWPAIKDGIRIEVDGAEIEPSLGDVQIPEVGDTDIARDSVLTLTAQLPDGDAPVMIGWNATYGPLVLRQVGEGDALYTGYLEGGQMSDPLPREGVAELGALQEFGRYVVLGFEHIVPKGLDHILFVLGLFFFSLHLRPLLWQVTAFTVAHTVTLALATLKIVTISPEIVEPLIAASIVYIAVENVLGGQMNMRRIVVIFAFGLLHGLGFASVLGEIGMNPSRLIADLVAFNIGVELGQLAVILAAFLLVGIWFAKKDWYRAVIAIPASVIIGLIGFWWFVERTIL
ncbi:hypothetical protein COL8621_03240 [Actibacterium lipolyticum]|uniref:HupE / UreJ protein n=2 Tax=Actibacterium lipolyticum TaxID=1524263 RepID=A0A238KVY2_9RHOB|nr:hypothetical protein COL8621_03240 [Actibacterium lipolyticum]